MSTNKKKNYLIDEFSQGTYGNLFNLTGEYASPVITNVASVPNNTGTQVYTGNSNAYQGGTVYLDMQNPTVAITNPTEVNNTSSLIEQNHVTNPTNAKPYTNIYGNHLKDIVPAIGTSVKTIEKERTDYGTQSDGSDVVDGSGGSGSGGEGSGSGGEGSGSGGEGSGEGGEDKEKVNTAPMTRAEYIEWQKGELEKQRKEAERQAEIYAQRARANAQASYMQNMSTYGINAETLAQMGLTGGGYSDYLNAQAYAQKQNAINTANANELTAKQQAQATYADNINKLEASAFDQRNTTYNSLLGMALDKTSGLTDEYIKAIADSVGLSQEEIDTIINTNNETQAKSAEEQYNALMLDLGNVNLYGNYTEDKIKAIAKSLGFEADSDKTTALVDAWKATKAQAEVDLEDTTGTSFDEIFSQIATDDAILQTVTKDSLSLLLSDGMRTGKIKGANGTITQEEIDTLMKAYELWVGYKARQLDTDTFKARINGLLNPPEQPTEQPTDTSTEKTDTEIANDYLSNYDLPGLSAKKAAALDKVVDLSNGGDTVPTNLTFKEFGDYQTNDKQKEYFNAIVSAVNANLGDKTKGIQPGQIISPNYGSRGLSLKDELFMYIGDGKFVAIDASAYSANSKGYLYIPDGYTLTASGKIKKI